jgi:hypothetical protein
MSHMREVITSLPAPRNLSRPHGVLVPHNEYPPDIAERSVDTWPTMITTVR